MCNVPRTVQRAFPSSFHIDQTPYFGLPCQQDWSSAICRAPAIGIVDIASGGAACLVPERETNFVHVEAETVEV
jgi:hypothetical protein